MNSDDGEKKRAGGGTSVVNANQIIKAYKFYEDNPSGLLLLLATSSEEQSFFEDVYNQITETGGQVQIPNLI